MATLYVTEQGARVEKEYRRFLVTKHDEMLLAVPAIRVSEVVLVGRVGVTTPALQAMLREGVGLTLLSRTGQLLVTATIRPVRVLKHTPCRLQAKIWQHHVAETIRPVRVLERHPPAP